MNSLAFVRRLQKLIGLKQKCNMSMALIDQILPRGRMQWKFELSEQGW